MGELARRRSARDLWISRSHVLAAALGATLLGVTAFSAGVLVGGGERAHAAANDPLGLSQAPDDSLVELLARVEASADATGGVAELTFPGVLAGEGEGVAVPEAPRGFSGAATVSPSGTGAPEADPMPSGSWTLTLLATRDVARAHALRDQLRARDLPAWVAAERVQGVPVYRVCLGGYDSAAEARAAGDRFGAVAEDVPLVAAARVDPLRAEGGGR